MIKTFLQAPVRLAIVVALLASALTQASGARAQAPDPLVADSLAALDALVASDVCVERDATDNDVDNGVELPYRFCDDGVVPSGGGSNGIPVPVKYAANEAGDDWTGLPSPASEEEVAEAEEDDLRPEDGNRITLDVDITLPPAARPPIGGFPVIAFMHGCCGGNRNSWEAPTIDGNNELWHHSNSWFASRGYVVINYTARGFRNSSDQGSTGTTQLDSRRYEINDFQYLVGLLADHDAAQLAAGEAMTFNINSKKVAAVGGSYGGGFTWLALTDPKWSSPAGGIPLRLRAAVPKYGWTDLVESLVPSGHYFDRDPDTGKTFIAPTDPAKALSRAPIGVIKQSIVAGLYATGNLMTGNHTIFPNYIHEANIRLQQGEPYENDPILTPVMDSFLNDRSAYFQEAFWKKVAKGFKVPIFNVGTWTDPLFPTLEHIRFYNKLTKLNPEYPITTYLGDLQHFTANKPKEWGDLCGDDHHVCTIDDYRDEADVLGNLNKAPIRIRQGINSRISKFLDYYLQGKGKQPKTTVSATTTICEANADPDGGLPVDEPGIEYRAPTWRELAPRTLEFSWIGGGPALTSAGQDNHAAESDPVFRGQQTNKCFTTDGSSPPGTAVSQLVSEEIADSFTMLGIPTLKLDYAATGTNYWLSGRLFDLAPDGSMTLVARHGCRVNSDAAPDIDCKTFDLSGNGWYFGEGHKLVVEVSQADTPYLRRDNLPSSVDVNGATIVIPVTKSKLQRDPRF